MATFKQPYKFSYGFQLSHSIKIDFLSFTGSLYIYTNNGFLYVLILLDFCSICKI